MREAKPNIEFAGRVVNLSQETDQTYSIGHLRHKFPGGGPSSFDNHSEGGPPSPLFAAKFGVHIGPDGLSTQPRRCEVALATAAIR